MVIESINALRLNLIDYGEATIKSDVDAWVKKRKEVERKETILKSYEKLFGFIILTLNRYGMLFDTQPRGFSNVEMKSV